MLFYALRHKQEEIATFLLKNTAVDMDEQHPTFGSVSHFVFHLKFDKCLFELFVHGKMEPYVTSTISAKDNTFQRNKQFYLPLSNRTSIFARNSFNLSPLIN
jgi:hypothetical protein